LPKTPCGRIREPGRTGQGAHPDGQGPHLSPSLTRPVHPRSAGTPAGTTTASGRPWKPCLCMTPSTVPGWPKWLRLLRVCPFEFSLDLSLWAGLCRLRLQLCLSIPGCTCAAFSERSEVLLRPAGGRGPQPGGSFPGHVFRRTDASGIVLATRRAVKVEPAAHIPAARQDQPGTAGVEEGVRPRREASPAPGIHRRRLYPLLREFLKGMAERWLARNQPADWQGGPAGLLLCRQHAFMRVAEAYDDTYATCSESTGSELRLKLFCMDPAPQVASRPGQVPGGRLFFCHHDPAGLFPQNPGVPR
jgi:hypothetical protein